MKTAVLVWACLLAPFEAEAESPRAARYAIDAQRSTISWELPATLHTVRGTVPELSGSVELETGPGGEQVVRGRVSVRAAAMKTGNESRDQKMREKVLEVDRYPEIVFDLDAVEADWSKLAGGGAFDAKVSGRLTVHGTRSLSRFPFPSSPRRKGSLSPDPFRFVGRAMGSPIRLSGS
jgi:polyisoprenoid-binding protein YceI